jgi:hypothetical protein
MVSQSLVNYVKTLLNQRYDLRTIRSTLRGAGYTQYDIQEALAEAQKPHVVHTKTLIIAFAIVLVITVSIIVALKVAQPEPVDLELSLKTYKLSVAPGEQLIMTANIVNPSGRETQAILDLDIKGPKKIVAPSESLEVGAKAAVPIAISIPQDATIGQYTLIAKLAYGSKKETATQYFEIVQERVESPTVVPREEEERAVQKQCPGGCNDLNPCTDDICVKGQCQYKATSPCCGNGICELGEENCVDCAEDVISEAIREAAKDPEGSAEKCSQDPANADQCYKDIAKIANDKKYCDYIQDSKWKDPCLMHFAYDGDYTVCGELQNKFMRNSCNSLKNLAKYK